jgi:fructokinase
VVWGELLWDRFPEGDQLGGAPANVAWHLAQLGAGVALVTRVGADRDGDEARARLAAAGVDTSLIQVDDERATGEVTVTVDRDTGEPRYRLVPGRAWERIELNPMNAARLSQTRALVFGTLAQRQPEGLAALRGALDAASPGVLRVCDPNLRPSSPSPGDDTALIAALRRPQVVKLGEREVAMISARLGIADPVTWLLQEGARLVAVTRGAAGSTWFAPGGAAFEVAAVPARPGGDNVGCGDAYVAGMVHGLLAGWPWPRIGRLAAALAAEVASARGATPVVDGRVLIASVSGAHA